MFETVINVPKSEAEKMCEGKDFFQLVEDLKSFRYWFLDDGWNELAIYIMSDGSQIFSSNGEHTPLPYQWTEKQLKAKGYIHSLSTQEIIDWANSYNNR